MSLSSPASAQEVDYSVSVTNLESDLSSLLSVPAYDAAYLVGSVLQRTRSPAEAIEVAGAHLSASYGVSYENLGTTARYRASYDERTQTVQVSLVVAGSFRLSLSTLTLDIVVRETTLVTALSRAVAPPPTGAKVHFMAWVEGQDDRPQALESSAMGELIDTMVTVLDGLPSGDLWIEHSQMALAAYAGEVLSSGIIYKMVKDPVTGLPVPRCCEEFVVQVPSGDGLLQAKIAEDTGLLE